MKSSTYKLGFKEIETCLRFNVCQEALTGWITSSFLDGGPVPDFRNDWTLTGF